MVRGEDKMSKTKSKINLITIATLLTIITTMAGAWYASIKLMNKGIAIAEEIKKNEERISVLELQKLVDLAQEDYYRAKKIAFANPGDKEAELDFDEAQRSYRNLKDRLITAKLKK